MRFLADMGVSQRVVVWLRDQGHDVAHARELGLARAKDSELVARAAQEARVVLTFDLDFGALAALASSPMCSVILFRLRDAAVARVIERLAVALASHQGDLKSGAVLLVEETRLRLRRLPIRL